MNEEKTMTKAEWLEIRIRYEFWDLNLRYSRLCEYLKKVNDGDEDAPSFPTWVFYEQRDAMNRYMCALETRACLMGIDLYSEMPGHPEAPYPLLHDFGDERGIGFKIVARECTDDEPRTCRIVPMDMAGNPPYRKGNLILNAMSDGCSECGFPFDTMNNGVPNYCQNCGARVETEEEA